MTSYFTIYSALLQKDVPCPSWFILGEYNSYIATAASGEPRLLQYNYDHETNTYHHVGTQGYTLTQLETLMEHMEAGNNVWLPFLDDASMFPTDFDFKDSVRGFIEKSFQPLAPDDEDTQELKKP